ncbi:VCBS repeat-containing protein [Salmonirosea aquatica]
MRPLLLLIPVLALVVWALVPQPPAKLFRQLPSSRTGISFNNRIQESDSLNVLRFEYLYNGGGVGIGDFNKDGWQDVFFTGNQVSCRLYLNQGQLAGKPLTFKDITKEAGVGTNAWCTGVTVVDINQDGWDDIYVSVAGFGPDTTRRRNLLFVNQASGAGKPVTFREQAQVYGLDDCGYSTQTAFFDYDHDGDLDAYVLTNALDQHNRNALRPKHVKGEAASNDRLYRNEGVGAAGHPVFANVTREAGILTEGYGLGIAVSDLNGDGWEDIYCSNDFLSNDLIWVNNRNGTFTNRAPDYLTHQTHNAMGVDIADIDNDQLPDIMVVDMLPGTNERRKMMLPGYNYNRFQMDLAMGYQPQFMRNTLQLNRGQSGGMQEGVPSRPNFSDISQLAGVDRTDWSWAPLFADFDNDGYRDLLITNGYRRDVTNLDFTAYLADLHAGGFGEGQKKNAKAYQQLLQLPEVKLANYCYRNRGGEGTLAFEDVSEKWGFDAPSFSNGAAYADLDNDGDLDIVINAIDDEAFVYENTLNQESQKKVPENNTWLRLTLDRNSALGTKVNLYYNSKVQTAELNPTRGYVSSVEPFLHFGLGNAAKVDSVEIIWNNGQYQVLRNIPANQLLHIPYRPMGIYKQPLPTTPAYFQEIDPQLWGLDYTHTETEFNDFARTPLLPHKQSQNGPPLAVADVDGNGLDDLFIGSDFEQESYLYLQQANGRFFKTKVPKEANQEDTGALFFDADQDGDSDLYVVSGGSHAEGTSAAYQDRLYLNDGVGNFSLSRQSLPTIDISGSCVVAGDFDQDGDLDLFRGSRLIPGQYPMPGKSFLLENRGGRFLDVTDQLAPSLRTLGLVTSAAWADTDRDGWPDLALCGEWMPITILSNQAGKQFSVHKVPGSSGWWNTLTARDFDQDGDLDLMAGNLGLNTKYRASPDEPLEVYAADFDNNGRIDPILTEFNGNRKWILPTRDLITSQIPSMKRRFSDFQSFATATFEESFTEEEIQSAYHLSCTELRTMYFENTGTTFKPHPLPQEAQFAPVYGIWTEDFNHDGYLDALLVGNSYASETVGGWQDASKGTLLLGAGKGAFRYSPNPGILADKEAKGLVTLQRTDGVTWIVIANNGNRLQIFQWSQNRKEINRNSFPALSARYLPPSRSVGR